MKQVILNILAAIAFIGLVIFVITYWAGMPIVKESYSTAECVEVMNFKEGDNYTCENLPKKYEHMWVE